LLLAQALADEVQIPPKLVEAVATRLARYRDPLAWINGIPRKAVLSGKYGAVYRARVTELFLSSRTVDPDVAGNLADIVNFDQGLEELSPTEALRVATELCREGELLTRAAGALLISRLAFQSFQQRGDRQRRRAAAPAAAARRSAAAALAKLILDQEVHGVAFAEFATCWGFAWSFNVRWADRSTARRVLPRLIEIWQARQGAASKRWAAWAILEAPLLERGVYDPGDRGRFEVFVRREISRDDRGDTWFGDRAAAACVLAYYEGNLLSDEEIAMGMRAVPSYHSQRRAFAALGELLNVGLGQDASR
jgi:hypothetical protein